MKKSYSEIASNAIRDFDSIYESLISKKVEKDNLVLTLAERDDGTVSTENYPELINQLFRIGSGESSLNVSPINEDGVITNLEKEEVNLEVTNIERGIDGKDEFILKIPVSDKNGYYHNDTIINTKLNGAKATFEGTSVSSLESKSVIFLSDSENKNYVTMKTKITDNIEKNILPGFIDNIENQIELNKENIELEYKLETPSLEIDPAKNKYRVDIINNTETNSITIETKDKYSQYDIEVNIGPNIMGENIIDQLTKLEKRMNGEK